MSENIGKVFSGFEFKQLCKTDFYKILSENLIHHGYQYIDGVNVCSQEFNPKNECSSGGLYFTELNKIPSWLTYRSDLSYIVKVEILDDSLIYVEENKFKANKFSVDMSTKCEIKDFPFWNDMEFCKLAVQQNVCTLLHVKEQTEELCKLAVQKNSDVLLYVKEQTEEICKLAVQQNGCALEYVKDQTEELCKLAVQNDGCALFYVKDEFKAICST